MSASGDMTLAAIKLVLSLVLILGLLWALQRWLVRCRSGGVAPQHRKFIRIVDSHYLGAKKSIVVVQVPGSLLVVGLGATEINLLARIDEDHDSAQSRAGTGAEDLSAASTLKSGGKSASFLERFKELVGR